MAQPDRSSPVPLSCVPRLGTPLVLPPALSPCPQRGGAASPHVPRLSSSCPRRHCHCHRHRHRQGTGPRARLPRRGVLHALSLAPCHPHHPRQPATLIVTCTVTCTPSPTPHRTASPAPSPGACRLHLSHTLCHTHRHPHRDTAPPPAPCHLHCHLHLSPTTCRAHHLPVTCTPSPALSPRPQNLHHATALSPAPCHLHRVVNIITHLSPVPCHRRTHTPRTPPRCSRPPVPAPPKTAHIPPTAASTHRRCRYRCRCRCLSVSVCPSVVAPGSGSAHSGAGGVGVCRGLAVSVPMLFRGLQQRVCPLRSRRWRRRRVLPGRGGVGRDRGDRDTEGGGRTNEAAGARVTGPGCHLWETGTKDWDRERDKGQGRGKGTSDKGAGTGPARGHPGPGVKLTPRSRNVRAGPGSYSRPPRTTRNGTQGMAWRGTQGMGHREWHGVARCGTASVDRGQVCPHP